MKYSDTINTATAINAAYEAANLEVIPQPSIDRVMDRLEKLIAANQELASTLNQRLASVSRYRKDSEKKTVDPDEEYPPLHHHIFVLTQQLESSNAELADMIHRLEI